LIDEAKIEKAAQAIIEAIGEDPHREGLVDTPKRVARMYAEIFSGIGLDPTEVLNTGFNEEHKEMVALKDIQFYSMCEHHLLPFFGVAHIGYIPAGKVVGISKLARALSIIAARPQLQERLTSQLADAIMTAVKPMGVGVVVEAQHLCMSMRGVKTSDSIVVTSAMRGIFRKDTSTRTEFLSLIKKQR